jgi:glutamyl endopeptidase
MARNSIDARKSGSSSASPAVLDEAAAIVKTQSFLFTTSDKGVSTTAESSDQLGIASALSGNPPDGLLLQRSLMVETYGGGSLESVPGFDAAPILTQDIAQPGLVWWPQLSRPVAGASELLEIIPESVIGRDTRRPVPSSASLPWRCIAYLRIRYQSGREGTGTGWFISPRTLVTAAHCMVHPEAGRATRVIVAPGFHAGAMPWGSFEAVGGDWNPAWERNFDPVLDYALVHIDRNPGIGHFGYSAAADPNLRRVLVNLAGYPSDRSGTQWYDASRIADLDRHFIYHEIDTETGQSGAPLFWTDRVQRIGLGIHTYGVGGGFRTNRARRITPELFELFGRLAR